MSRLSNACFAGWLLLACSSPEPAALSVSRLSDRGLIDADVRVVAPVERGDNELFVALRPHVAGGKASLIGVKATMPAHGHSTTAGEIVLEGAEYHARALNLFMSGRWLLELELQLDDQSDRASLPVDVP